MPRFYTSVTQMALSATDKPEGDTAGMRRLRLVRVRQAALAHGLFSMTFHVGNGTECHYTDAVVAGPDCCAQKKAVWRQDFLVSENPMKHLLLALIMSAALTAQAADEPSMQGPWKLHSSISGYESDLDCSFTQDGAEFSGTCKSDTGELKVTGKVDAGKIVFAYKTIYQGDELTVTHTGKAETAGKVVGTVAVDPIGVGGDFTAIQTK